MKAKLTDRETDCEKFRHLKNKETSSIRKSRIESLNKLVQKLLYETLHSKQWRNEFKITKSLIT